MSHQIKPKGFVHAAGGSNSAGGLGSVTSPAISHWERPVKKEGSKTSEAMVASASSMLTHIVLFYAEKKKKISQILENLGWYCCFEPPPKWKNFVFSRQVGKFIKF